MLKLNKTRVHKEKFAKRDSQASGYIPYRCHWNPNTILTKDGGLLQTIKVQGFSFETADDEDLDLKKDLRNSLYKGLSSGSISLYFHTIRRKQNLPKKNEFTSDPYAVIPDDFITYVQQEWEKKYTKFESFVNELYVTIIWRPEKEGATAVLYYYKKLTQGHNKENWEADMRDMYDNLEEISHRVINTFKEYNPKLLGLEQRQDGMYCSLLEFLGTIVNCGKTYHQKVPTIDIDKYLCNHRLYFGDRALEGKGPFESKYGGIISIQEYGPSTSAGIFDSFLQMPCEFIMTQSFSFSNRQVAINSMQLQQNRMIQAGDQAVSQIQEISDAIDMATSGDIAFGEHHFTIMCMEDDLKALENSLSLCSVELTNCGIQPVREMNNLEPSFWGQLPGNEKYLVRRSTINTLNLASFASMHNYPTGKKDDNHWGEHVTILDTTSGTPFYFNFHVNDVGHTLIIGPTGSGKTVLMNFLCAQAQKFRPRTYFFDKDRGAEIFVRALGGTYFEVDPGSSINFNPLQLPETKENKNFLLEWIKLLVTVNGEKLSAEDNEILNQAIEGNFKLDPKDRVLRNIVPFLGIKTEGSLASRISIWHSGGSHCNVFDNEHDDIDLGAARVFGFEMAELLKDPVSLGPVLLYLFHRINNSLDGSPTMIVLDEAWALIDNPIFGPKIKDWLKVLRKLNAFVIFATQSVEDAANSDISDTLIQQTATQIFLPNLKATSIYKTHFMLSEREYSIVKNTSPSSRFFLVKQATSAVVARVNLAGMDNIINVLSGGSSTVRLVDQLRRQYGDDPEEWLKIFYEEAKKLKE